MSTEIKKQLEEAGKVTAPDKVVIGKEFNGTNDDFKKLIQKAVLEIKKGASEEEKKTDLYKKTIENINDTDGIDNNEYQLTEEYALKKAGKPVSGDVNVDQDALKEISNLLPADKESKSESTSTTTVLEDKRKLELKAEVESFKTSIDKKTGEFRGFSKGNSELSNEEKIYILNLYAEKANAIKDIYGDKIPSLKKVDVPLTLDSLSAVCYQCEVIAKVFGVKDGVRIDASGATLKGTALGPRFYVLLNVVLEKGKEELKTKADALKGEKKAEKAKLEAQLKELEKIALMANLADTAKKLKESLGSKFYLDGKGVDSSSSDTGVSSDNKDSSSSTNSTITKKTTSPIYTPPTAAKINFSKSVEEFDEQWEKMTPNNSSKRIDINEKGKAGAWSPGFLGIPNFRAGFIEFVETTEETKRSSSESKSFVFFKQDQNTLICKIRIVDKDGKTITLRDPEGKEINEANGVFKNLIGIPKEPQEVGSSTVPTKEEAPKIIVVPKRVGESGLIAKD